MASAAERILGAASGLIGAAGVGLAAAGAHFEPGTPISSAALIALVHAPAVLAILAARRAGLVRSFPATLAATLLICGTVLFCADISLRVFAKTSLFPMAAPTGGMILIAGWLMAAGAVAFARR